MKFKEEIEENKLNRFDIEAKINRGIEIFNENNENEDIPLLNEYYYDIKNITYEYEDECILISWERDEGRCGDEYLVDYNRKIPYVYFESTKDEIEVQDKIKEDTRLREEKNRIIKKKESEIDSFKKELLEHEHNLRDYEKIKKRYIGNIYFDKKIEKSIEREIIKCKGALYLEEDNLIKIKEEK